MFGALFIFVFLFCDLGAQPAAREYDVKATLLFNFCHFVEWPEAALGDASAPFVIGILGKDPFGKFLDDLVRKERAHGRPIEVRRLSRLDEASGASLLFISRSELPRIDSVLAALKGRPTLTVGEADDRGFPRGGAMIAFVTERENIRIRINLNSARSAGLTISAKLLRLAEIVRTENNGNDPE